LDKIVNFLKNNEITAHRFEKDRKLHIFINSSLQFVSIAKRIINITMWLRENPLYSSYIDLDDRLKGEVDKLMKIINSLGSQKFNYRNIIESHIIEKVHCDYSEAKNDKVCLICLHELEVDTYTNVFSFDFHIQCINFWLNCVDNVSPYIL
jgi:hypothetical protein